MELKDVVDIASPLIRKYDWRAEKSADGILLTVTDGQEEASVNITPDEDIETEIKKLITAVDNHEYVVIG